MERTTHTALLEAARSAFARLGASSPNVQLTGEQADERFDAACRVRFYGAMTGILDLAVFGPVLAQLTADVSTDEESSRARRLEALAQATRIVCSNILHGRSGSQANYDLSAPEVSTAPALTHAFDGEVVARAVLGVGLGRVEVEVRTRS